MKLASCATAAEVRDVWPRVLPLFKQCEPHLDGAYTLDWVFEQLLAQHWQLWYAVNDDEIVGCCVTYIADYPDLRVCVVPLVAAPHGRDSFGIFRFVAHIERWAKQRGCAKLESYGQKAWLRRLTSWYSPFVILRKDIE